MTTYTIEFNEGYISKEGTYNSTKELTKAIKEVLSYEPNLKGYNKFDIVVHREGKENFEARMDADHENFCIIAKFQHSADFYKSQRGIEYFQSMKKYLWADSADEMANFYQELANDCKETKLDQNADSWLWMCGE